MPLLSAVPGRIPSTKPRLLLLGALLLTACGAGSSSTSTSTSVKDALNFSSTNLPVAYVGEVYNAPLPVSGGVSPYLVKLVDGSLPDGLSLSSGGIVGSPTAVGVSNFTLEASDASLSTKDQKFSLNVSAQVAFSLSPVLPNGPVGPSRIPLILSHPLGAVAARFQWKLPDGVKISAVAAGDGAPVLIWHQKGKLFTLDLGFRKVPQNGAQVAMLTLSTKNPVLLASAPTGYQGRDATGAMVKGNQDVNATLNTFGTSTGGISTFGASTLGSSTSGTSSSGTSTNGLSTLGTSGSSTQGTSGASTAATSADSTGADSTGATSTDGASTDSTSTGATSADSSAGDPSAGASTTAVPNAADSTSGDSK